VEFGERRGVALHWHLSSGVSGVTLAFWLGLRVFGSIASLSSLSLKLSFTISGELSLSSCAFRE
jgi:hypothetical protein